jgi:hypothetical protein
MVSVSLLSSWIGFAHEVIRVAAQGRNPFEFRPSKLEAPGARSWNATVRVTRMERQ